MAKLERAQEARLKNDEARAKAAQRMNATLQANRSILKQRRAEYDQRQRENEQRRQCAPLFPLPSSPPCIATPHLGAAALPWLQCM